MKKDTTIFANHLPLLSEILGQRFIQRWDLYACQLAVGRYVCIHKPLGPQHLVAHLQGQTTLGAYLLDVESRARFMVLDADTAHHWHQLKELAVSVSRRGIPCYLEQSRRGGHLWFFFARPLLGKDVRRFGQGLLAVHHLEKLELFPKQSVLEGGPGSLIRLPFGVHCLSGKRYGFLTLEGHRLAPTIREQVMLFRDVATVPNWALRAYGRLNSGAPRRKTVVVSESADATLSGQIKGSVSVFSFVGQYVELSADGLGRCPFHDDQHPSFAVKDAENYWHCFAGCGGGSIIDFWMKWRKCDFRTAIRELANMLL